MIAVFCCLVTSLVTCSFLVALGALAFGVAVAVVFLVFFLGSSLEVSWLVTLGVVAYTLFELDTVAWVFATELETSS